MRGPLKVYSEAGEEFLLKAMAIRNITDLSEIQENLGRNIVLILDLTPLARESLDEMKSFVEQLYEFATSAGRDIGRIGDAGIIIAPLGERPRSESPIEYFKGVALSLDSGEERVIERLKSREATSFDDVLEIWLSQVPHGAHIDFTDKDVVELLEDLISEGVVKGFVDVDRRQFIHMTAYKQTQTVIHYDIASSFNFSGGMVKIQCSSCGSSDILREKRSEAKCAHCGTTYIIPNKILDLI